MKAQGAFSPLNPGEGDVYGFDFTFDLATGDSVNGAIPPVWSCTDAAGVDPNPQARLEGPPTLTGNKTYQVVGGPVAGAIYVLSAKVQPAISPKPLILWAFLPCRAIGSTGS